MFVVWSQHRIPSGLYLSFVFKLFLSFIVKKYNHGIIHVNSKIILFSELSSYKIRFEEKEGKRKDEEKEDINDDACSVPRGDDDDEGCKWSRKLRKTVFIDIEKSYKI